MRLIYSFILLPACIFFISCHPDKLKVPQHFNTVDQVIWVVSDLNNVMDHWKNLGFNQMIYLDTVQAILSKTGTKVELLVAKANLGGAHITWIQPLEEKSVFARFHSDYGDGAMSLVHRLYSEDAFTRELARLSELGVDVLEEVSITTGKGNLVYVLMDTREEGKYYLGYTYGDLDDYFFKDLKADNLHNLKINQYAFAIRNQKPVSEFWAKLGQPDFQINYPELGNMHYYGEPTDHELIQGWQRHGSIAYEWCIPVKPPIVYEDHIKAHGEGIHHLAFTVEDMDVALKDFTSRGYINSMGGTWGEEGKPGSGRYEYINLEHAGGVTMELLWNFK